MSDDSGEVSKKSIFELISDVMYKRISWPSRNEFEKRYGKASKDQSEEGVKKAVETALHESSGSGLVPAGLPENYVRPIPDRVGKLPYNDEPGLPIYEICYLVYTSVWDCSGLEIYTPEATRDFLKNMINWRIETLEDMESDRAIRMFKGIIGKFNLWEAGRRPNRTGGR
jgi:hypothetical protein